MKKEVSNKKAIIAIIVVIALLAILVILYVNLFKNNNDKRPLTPIENTNKISEEKKH